jgi:uncharacterized protein with HEPN domain
MPHPPAHTPADPGAAPTTRKISASLDDQLVIDAICMRLSAGVEALARLDTATRDRLFGDAWPLMWGMRNRIAHGYLLVDTDIVRRTLEHDIPPILTGIEAELTDAG